MKNLVLAILIASTALCRTAGAAPAWCPGSTATAKRGPALRAYFSDHRREPRLWQIIGNPKAPNINRLAKSYGSATQFYGEVHPSKANYIAMLAAIRSASMTTTPFIAARQHRPLLRKGGQDRALCRPHRDGPQLPDQLAEHHLT